MRYICLFIALTVINPCWASQTYCAQKIAITVQPGYYSLVGQAFALLARGYWETGPCVAPIALRMREELEKMQSPQLPSDVIGLMSEYFATPQPQQAIDKELESNAWALFEKHIGNPVLKGIRVHLDRTLYRMFADKMPDIRGTGMARGIIKLCLDDLQKLTTMGCAYNPYEEVPGAQVPRLMMHIPRVSNPTKCCHDVLQQIQRDGFNFVVCGSLSKHTYQESINTIENGRRVCYKPTVEGSLVHTRDNEGRDAYCDSDNPISERTLKSRGGTFDMYAILYRHAATKPCVNQKRSNADSCIIL